MAVVAHAIAGGALARQMPTPVGRWASMPPRATLHHLLRDERRARGLSLREAAKVTGVDASSLSSYEADVLPDHPTLVKILKGYGVPAEPFLAALDYPISPEAVEHAVSWAILVQRLVDAGESRDDAVEKVKAARVLLGAT